jgi:hypothetical protein
MKGAVAKRQAPTARDGQPAGFGVVGRAAALLTVALPVAFVLALPTALLLLIGLLPTLATFVIDDSRQRYAARCVGAFNLCGVAPFLGELWTGSNDLNGLVTVIADVYAWLVMYGAATIGWLLYISMPPLLNVILTNRDERRTAQLRELQQRLVQEWGPGVGRHVEHGMLSGSAAPMAKSTAGDGKPPEAGSA